MKKLLLLPLLVLPLIADDAQPLSNNFATVGAVYKSHVNFWAEYGRMMKGFYMVTGIQTVGIYNHQLQTSVTESVCYLHNLGEYLTVGGCGSGGIAMDANAKGMTEGSDLSAEYKFGKSQHWGFRVKGGFVHSAIGGNITEVAAGPTLHWK